MIPLGLKETKELDWATSLKVDTGLGTLRDSAVLFSVLGPERV